MNTERSSTFLMANLGAEVSRIFSAQDKSDEAQVNECFDRALKILKSIETRADMKARIPEMNALSMVIRDIVNPHPVLKVSRKNISSYFVPFALSVMDSGK